MNAAVRALMHRGLALCGGAASLFALAAASEVRLRRAERPLTDRWHQVPVEPRHSTLLGLSFRPPQVEALGLDARATLPLLLEHPFQVIRLGAYWNRIEAAPGEFHPEELDWKVDLAER